jgi:choline dehydrogenase
LERRDHYEIGVTAKTPNEYTILAKCTLGLSTPDPCLADWVNTPRVGSIYGAAYDASGFAVAAYIKSSVTTNDEFDVMALGSPASFTGYFPGYSIADYSVKDAWSYVILKSHPRSRAGSVTLRSADPLDVPAINYRFFQDQGELDLQAMYEGIQYARDAFARQPIQYNETLPGSAIQS